MSTVAVSPRTRGGELQGIAMGCASGRAGRGWALAREGAMMSEQTAYVLGTDDGRSRGSTPRRARSRRQRRRGCARRGSAVPCACSTSGPASATWPCRWPALLDPEGSVLGVDQAERLLEIAEQRRAAARARTGRIPPGRTRGRSARASRSTPSSRACCCSTCPTARRSCATSSRHCARAAPWS